MREDDGDIQMDDIDLMWVNSFIGKSIPEGAMVEGFISVISWMDEHGELQWRTYNTLDKPLSSVLGLLTMAQHQLMIDNTIQKDEE